MSRQVEAERRDGAERLPPELAFLSRHGVPPAVLVTAADLSRVWGVSGDEALVASGLLSAEALYRALGAEIGLPFMAGGFVVHPRARPDKAVVNGLAPLDRKLGDLAFAYAPRGPAFAEVAAGRSLPSSVLLLTTPDGLREALFAARGEAIAQEASEALARQRPEDSFHGSVTMGQITATLLLAALVGTATTAMGGAALLVVTLLLSLPFLGLAVIKLGSTLERVPIGMDPGQRMGDADLPVYTVLVPLYRERRILPQLLNALAALDYPAAKLDVKLLVEEGDRETASAISELPLPGYIEVVTVPAGAPRTKPRALNVGLPLARGEYLVIYDAEDVPDAGQLRKAASIFARSAPDVACLQARLVIDNTDDSVLTRFFTVEYGALFDVVNPALARSDLPVPLGGTSNHFRVEVLRELAGWDPWNVTEDADLAIRLARAGFRVGDLPSATLEEAPAGLRAWMAQRTRWMKGFIQVTITHSRHPLNNLARLGPVRLFGAVSVILGSVASAIVYPVFTLLVVAGLLSGAWLSPATAFEAISTGLGLTLLVTGVLAMILPGFVAIARRRWWALWPYALLMPAYYLLVSIAAWRAIAEIVRDPDRWNKTEHGLARTTRSGALGTSG